MYSPCVGSHLGSYNTLSEPRAHSPGAHTQNGEHILQVPGHLVKDLALFSQGEHSPTYREIS